MVLPTVVNNQRLKFHLNLAKANVHDRDNIIRSCISTRNVAKNAYVLQSLMHISSFKMTVNFAYHLSNYVIKFNSMITAEA